MERLTVDLGTLGVIELDRVQWEYDVGVIVADGFTCGGLRVHVVEGIDLHTLWRNAVCVPTSSVLVELGVD